MGIVQYLWVVEGMEREREGQGSLKVGSLHGQAGEWERANGPESEAQNSS